MTWESAFRIVATAVASGGGIGAIIVAAFKFSVNKITERLVAEYQVKLDKELEKYKAEINKKEYVSKTRFDTEFAIYRELSEAFSEAIEGVHGIIPSGIAYYPIDDEQRNDYEKNLFRNFAKSSYNAQKILFENAMFIPKEICDQFSELMDLIRTQSEVYNEASFETTISKAEREITQIDIDRTALIDEKFEQLSNEVRTYLSNLEILDD